MNILKSKMRTATSGFTIVELLVVVVVVGILATITIVTFGNITQRATKTALTAEIGNSERAYELEQYTKTNGAGFDPRGSAYLTRETSLATVRYVYGSSKEYCFVAEAKNGSIVVHKTTFGGANIVGEGDCPEPGFRIWNRCIGPAAMVSMRALNTFSENIYIRTYQASTQQTIDHSSTGTAPGNSANFTISTTRSNTAPDDMVAAFIHNAAGQLLETYYMPVYAITCGS